MVNKGDVVAIDDKQVKYLEVFYDVLELLVLDILAHEDVQLVLDYAAEHIGGDQGFIFIDREQFHQEELELLVYQVNSELSKVDRDFLVVVLILGLEGAVVSSDSFVHVNVIVVSEYQFVDNVEVHAVLEDVHQRVV